MSNEWMITKFHDRICSCYYEEGRLTELQILSDSGKSASGEDAGGMDKDADVARPRLGNIYIGRVQNIVRNLEAAFVEIQPGTVCYYSLEEPHLFMRPKSTDRLAVGDEILVQVTKEAMKTKAPSVSSRLHLTGSRVVVTLGGHKVGISRKLPRDDKTKSLQAALEARLPEGYGAILRTNAYESAIEAVEEEFRMLLEQLTQIVEKAPYHKVFSCLYQEASPLKRLADSYGNDSLERIVTDLPDVREELLSFSPEAAEGKLTYYTGQMQPLYAVYRLDRDFKELTGKRVWLKSGAYLVIEQTEAMVVIDVNTGKAVNTKNREEHFQRINQEAATEIARQLKLRNLSGIILIDFIDMESPESREALIRHLCREIQKDRIPTSYIDMTKLNLVELTRKKVQKSLTEQLSCVI